MGTDKFMQASLANKSVVDRIVDQITNAVINGCLLYTSPSPRDPKTSRMPSSA